MSGKADVPAIDYPLLRGLTQRRISRGDMLRVSGAGLGAVGLSTLLGACGTSGAKSSGGSSGVGSTAWWDKQKGNGTVNFANWPLYIDVKRVSGKSVHPSLEAFTRQTGVKVNYKEVIQAYDSFFGKIRPSLAAGQNTGYDLIVMGYPKWLPLMIQLGYLVRLDKRRLTNFAKYGGASVKNPSYDPNNAHSTPWQSGITGIGYNPKLTGREITSYMDLMDTAFKGKVGMFGDDQDLPNLALVGLGIDPVTSTPKDWRKAAALLQRQKQQGVVRKYYDQSYVDALTRGDVALTMAWSGDIYQAQQSGSKDLKFVVPKEGGLLWTDCMCIPLHASNPLQALQLMDFTFKPPVAAMITEAVHYIAPVPASQSVIRSDAGKASKPSDKTSLDAVAASPLVFPSAADLKRLRRYRNLTAKETKQWNALFQPIYQS